LGVFFLFLGYDIIDYKESLIGGDQQLNIILWNHLEFLN
jgi:hypothetical protein